MASYLFALASILAGVICLVLSRTKKFYNNIDKKYGEAAARKMTNSLRLWGYFFLITSALLLLSLLLYCSPK